MKNKHRLIKGDYFFDERGSVSFINDFMLNPIVRFYEIIPKNTSIVRAWQAHKKESKWFYCSYGSFKINLIELDCFDTPCDNLTIHSYELNANNSQILY